MLSLGASIAQAAYSAAWVAAVPAVLARFWWRGRAEPAYRKAWAQRLGYWPKPPAAGPQAPRVWVHAVSLGETRAVQPLVQALRHELPGMQLLLTTGTATGLEAGQAILQVGDLHGWLPLDTPGATRRFLRTLQPQVGVLMETETWPNLLLQAQRAGVPMVLANARLSDRSLRKGLKWALLSRPMMQRLSAACAQTDQDADHLKQAGVPAACIQVLGNLKYELHPSNELQALGLHWASKGPLPSTGNGIGHQRRMVMAASWREGEDEPLLQAWLRAVNRPQAQCGPDPSNGARPLLLVVPRHPQRFEAVHALLKAAGLTVSCRSNWPETGPNEADWHCDVWLGDSLGEMPAYYAAADVALLGGSFAPLGGQNLIEAAACGCPVVMGPHTFNFEEAAQLAQAQGAAIRANDLDHAVDLALGTSAQRWKDHRLAGLTWVSSHAGAAQRQAQVVLSALKSDHAGAGE